MTTFISVSIVTLATFGIFQLRKRTSELKFALLTDSRLDGLLKFHLAQLALATLVLAITYIVLPRNICIERANLIWQSYRQAPLGGADHRSAIRLVAAGGRAMFM